MTNKGISIIVYSQNCEEALQKILQSFGTTNSFHPVEFIIFDYSSNDRIIEIIAEYAIHSFFRLIRPKSNQSFSCAFNLAAQRAQYPNLLFLSCSIDYIEDVLPTAIDILQNPSIGVVGVRLHNYHPNVSAPNEGVKVEHAGISLEWDRDDNHFKPVACFHHPDTKNRTYGSGVFHAVSGDFLLCRKSDFFGIGGFNEKLPLKYADVDLCLRLFTQLNLKTWCINDITLVIDDRISKCFLFSEGKVDKNQEKLVDFEFLTRNFCKKFKSEIARDDAQSLMINNCTKSIFHHNNLKTAKSDKSVSKPPTICGKFYRYPVENQNRIFEGGLRINTINSVNTNLPLVSVITVVYNKATTIAKCIESILSQSYSNIEHIIIDGASNDGTLDVIKHYEDSLAYIVSENDKGIYHAMNKGLLLAQGDYIAFLNADDYYFSYAIEESINNIDKNDLDISYAGLYFKDSNGNSILADEGREWDDSMLIQGIPGGHETFLAHKDCYNSIGGFDEQFRIVSDYDWCMRAYNYGFKAKLLKKPILVMQTGGVSFHEAVDKDENFVLFAKIFGELPEDMLELLYRLKYYKNWYDFDFDDSVLIEALKKANNFSISLQHALFLTIENRKREVLGKIKPKEKSSSKVLKIAVVLTYIKNVAGGAERIAIEAANELSRSGHAVTFVTCHGIAGEPFYSIDGDIPLIDLAIHPYQNAYIEKAKDFQFDYNVLKDHYYPSLEFSLTQANIDRWNNSHHLWITKLYKGFFDYHEFDIVISHMPSTYTYVLLGKEASEKTLHIASLHNSPNLKFFSDFYPAEDRMERYMRIVALERADQISVLFDQFKSQLPSSLGSKCFTLPNFLGRNFKNEKLTKKKKKNHLILSVGRLFDHKDHETLIKAYSTVRKKHPDWELNIYGEGPLKDYLKRICKIFNLDPDKILKGTTKNIEEIYRNADLFVFPSISKGFGLTVLEAMNCGLPCIAFDNCDGVKYLINDRQDGILVSSKNKVTNLANAIIRLIESPDIRRTLSKNAIKRSKSFSIAHHIKALEEVINNSNLNHDGTNKNFSNTKKPKLKVAIISTYLEGGAGMAAERLCKGLRAYGLDSKLISLSKSKYNYNYQMDLPSFSQFIYNNCLSIYNDFNQKSGGTLFSSSYPSLAFDQLSFLRHFDLINLHWVPTILSNEAITFLEGLGKPIVWTLHDMNPFTGGCHYSNQCEKYVDDCRLCPQVHERYKTYPGQILKIKQKYWSNEILIVTPSNWLADCAMKSKVFKQNKIEVIPNSVDTDTFRPIDKIKARKKFNLPIDKKIILFACHSHAERRKGFRELIQTIKMIEHLREQIHIITFGKKSDELNDLRLKYTSLGYIDDEKLVAIGYSAADLTVLPSLEDNLPNVILESVSCGTPVVAFNAGGIKDAVVDGITGYTVPKGDCAAFAEKIVKVFSKDLSKSCRDYALCNFSTGNQAVAYINLYNEMISGSKVSCNHKFKDAEKENRNAIAVFSEMHSLFYQYFI